MSCEDKDNEHNSNRSSDLPTYQLIQDQEKPKNNANAGNNEQITYGNSNNQSNDPACLAFNPANQIH